MALSIGGHIQGVAAGEFWRDYALLGVLMITLVSHISANNQIVLKR
ncbi:MAG: hypothetical protein M9927_07690 [Anaerolineae bacterium]|nr:hypothetical protein [Anaerolineae bacterium]